jgi:uncharacterized protein (DUF302 family)
MRYQRTKTGGLLTILSTAATAAYCLLGPNDAGVAPAGRAVAQQENAKPLTFTAARVNVTSRKNFDQSIKALEAAVPQADFAIFDPPGSAGADAAEVQKKLNDRADKDGLMILAQSDVGKRQSQLLGRKVRSKLYFIGNPLIAGRMIARNPAASLYVPLRVLVYEDQDGKAHVAYDRPSSVLGSLGDGEITRVAEMLDRKLKELVNKATE